MSGSPELRVNQDKWPFGHRLHDPQHWIARGYEIVGSVWDQIPPDALLNPESLSQAGIDEYSGYLHAPDIHDLVWIKPSSLTYVAEKPFIFVAWMGPSGSGKDTMIAELERTHPELFARIVTHTTKSPRPEDIPGNTYHFIPEDEFQRMMNNGELAEYIAQYGSSYGTSFSAISEAMASGKRVIVWRGEMIGWNHLQYQLQRRFGSDIALVSVFTVPEVTTGTLRLWIESKRKDEDSERRIQRAFLELYAAGACDIFILNPVSDKGPVEATQALLTVLESLNSSE